MADFATHIDLLSGETDGLLEKIDALIDAASPALTFGRRAHLCIGFTFAIYGGKKSVDGVPTEKTNQTFDLSPYPSSTVYLYWKPDNTFELTDSEPADWPAPPEDGAEALYTLTTDGDGVTGWIDHRTGGGGAISKAAILAALGIDDWVVTSEDITITKGAKTIVLDLE